MGRLVTLALLCASCSWAFVERYPLGAPIGTKVECTRSWRWPAVDLSVAAVGATVALVGIGLFLTHMPYPDGASAEGDRDLARVGVELMAGGDALMVPFALSGAYGARNVLPCRAD